ncbi:DUF2306 domain-containing protein [Bacillus timonensis]|nr:DUF2306 domain-containing protein [Bacillus timonensis]
MTLFQFFLIIHIIAGFLCLLTGLFAMIASKKRGKHTIFGEAYHVNFVVVFLSAVVMAILHWEESAYLFFIAFFSYFFALQGYIAGKKRGKNWLVRHIGGMLGSYIAIVTAVIVVNIGKVPYLNELPVLLFWFLPTIIGTPIITMVGRKYRVARK